MKVLDLFSGIGGFSLGLERAGMETVAFCEIEPFCQKVLKKHWADVPIYNDVTKLTKEVLENDGIGTIDVICGGYPCQPFSVAGKQKGSEDKRHLWPEMFRIIRQVKPRWVIAENVEGHIRLGLDTVLDDLEAEGYTCWTFIIPACAVGAPHQRNRVWIIANATSQRCNDRSDNREERPVLYNQNRDAAEGKSERERRKCRISQIDDFITDSNSFPGEQTRKASISEQTQRDARMGYSGCDGFTTTDLQRERIQGSESESVQGFSAFSWCKDLRGIKDLRNRQDIPEPLICRTDDGFSQRVDRLKALGNAVVPQIPELIGEAIKLIEDNREIL